MYLNRERALAEIANLDAQIAEHKTAIQHLTKKREMLVEQTKPPRRPPLTFDAAVKVTAKRLGLSYEEARLQLISECRPD